MREIPMRKFLFAAVLGLALSGLLTAVPAAAQTLTCGRTLVISAGATSIIQAVAASSSTSVVTICGYELNAGAAAATFQLTGGTGTNCNVNTVSLTPVFSLGINGVLVSRSITPQMQTAPGSSLCYTITGTGPMNAVVYYQQLQ
jgi:hypothetical protein